MLKSFTKNYYYGVEVIGIDLQYMTSYNYNPNS